MRTLIEGARGCGYRKEGGLYLVAPELSEPCPRLPIPAGACPCCGQGVKPARGWTWIKPAKLFPARVHGRPDHNAHCPLGAPEGVASVTLDEWHRTGDRAGLIWVGEAFYPTALSFTEEAAQMGVSRRIKAVPRGFEVGETFVFLGHRKALMTGTITKTETGLEVPTIEWTPGVVTVFKPTAIEYVVKGDETDEELAALEARGIEPVKVVKAAEE